jgi:hypothetical protein
MADVLEKPVVGGSFTGDLKGYVKVGSGYGHLSVWRLSWTNCIGLIYQGL